MTAQTNGPELTGAATGGCRNWAPASEQQGTLSLEAALSPAAPLPTTCFCMTFEDQTRKVTPAARLHPQDGTNEEKRLCENAKLTWKLWCETNGARCCVREDSRRREGPDAPKPRERATRRRKPASHRSPRTAIESKAFGVSSCRRRPVTREKDTVGGGQLPLSYLMASLGKYSRTVLLNTFM